MFESAMKFRKNRSLRFLLLKFLVLVLELIDAPCRVNELGFPGIEGMRGTGDLQLDERVLLPLHGDGLFGFGRGFGDENILVGHVLEGYQAVILGMYILSHDSSFF